jgi:hypothetical protein
MPDDAAILPAGLGHNQPPNLVEGDPEALRARLAADHALLISRFAELELGARQVPKVIADEATAERVVDWVAQQVRPAERQAEDAHKREKAPYLKCGRVVDEFFKDRLRRLTLAIEPVSNRAGDYLKKKAAEQRAREAEERARAQAEHERAQAEAHRLEAEAQKKAATDRSAAARLTVQAQEAQAKADDAAQIAAQPAAPVYVHGDYGATLYAKEEWDYEVEDPTQIPLGYLQPDDAAIRRAIKGGVRVITGLRIFSRDKTIIRRC